MEDNQQPIQAQTSRSKKPLVKKPKLSSSGKNNAITLLLVIFISVSAGFAGGRIGAQNNKQSGNVDISQGKQVAAEQSNLISTIAKDVGPSVVSVDVTSQGTVDSGFFGSQSVQQQSAGTGFIVSTSGYVVTNRHVVPAGTSKVSLTMSDGTVLDDVSVVGRTANSDPLDMAVLKINNAKGKTLKAVTLGDSSKMQVGATAIAIGNALGQFQNSVTAGIISGYGRDVQASDEGGSAAENLQNLFQTDAAINQGNSGGPLVNADGQVIGINTAVAGDGAQNIGFAIPINDAKGLINSVLKKGSIERPYLGVRYVQLTPAAAKQLKISTEEGAYIDGSSSGTGVVSGSPADKAGLKDKDIIIKVNDQDVNSQNPLSSVVGRFNVGDTVTVTFIRDGKQQTAQVTLAALPDSSN